MREADTTHIMNAITIRNPCSRDGFSFVNYAIVNFYSTFLLTVIYRPSSSKVNRALLMLLVLSPVVPPTLLLLLPLALGLISYWLSFYLAFA